MDMANVSISEILEFLQSAGIPYDISDEPGARAAYAKAFSAFGKRRCVAKC